VTALAQFRENKGPVVGNEIIPTPTTIFIHAVEHCLRRKGEWPYGIGRRWSVRRDTGAATYGSGRRYGAAIPTRLAEAPHPARLDAAPMSTRSRRLKPGVDADRSATSLTVGRAAHGPVPSVLLNNEWITQRIALSARLKVNCTITSLGPVGDSVEVSRPRSGCARRCPREDLAIDDHRTLLVGQVAPDECELPSLVLGVERQSGVCECYRLWSAPGFRSPAGFWEL